MQTLIYRSPHSPTHLYEHTHAQPTLTSTSEKGSSQGVATYHLCLFSFGGLEIVKYLDSQI
jgi:hypothetical protein